jgi:hypothetical protein
MHGTMCVASVRGNCLKSWARIKSSERFLGLMAIGYQARQQLDHKVDRTAMLGVHNLRDVFQLVEDASDRSSLEVW